MDQFLKLENLTVSSIWNGFVVVVVLALLFFALYKGVIMIRDDREKRKDKKSLGEKDITDKIADKVTAKLTPQIEQKFKDFEVSFDKKFEEIDSKLTTEQKDIDSHSKQLKEHESRVSKLEGGNKALCQGMLALLKQSAATSKTEKAMENYLITGEYNKEDWQ